MVALTFKASATIGCDKGRCFFRSDMAALSLSKSPMATHALKRGSRCAVFGGGDGCEAIGV